MTEFIVILLTLLVSAVIAFAVTFTVMTLFIARKRAVKPKHHFTGMADLREQPATEVSRRPSRSPVDNESAAKEWSRGNGKSQY